MEFVVAFMCGMIVGAAALAIIAHIVVARHTRAANDAYDQVVRDVMGALANGDAVILDMGDDDAADVADFPTVRGYL